jgi:hypothetical protein
VHLADKRQGLVADKAVVESPVYAHVLLVKSTNSILPPVKGRVQQQSTAAINSSSSSNTVLPHI